VVRFLAVDFRLRVAAALVALRLRVAAAFLPAAFRVVRLLAVAMSPSFHAPSVGAEQHSYTNPYHGCTRTNKPVGVSCRFPSDVL
jgi:hypothetical protein